MKPQGLIPDSASPSAHERKEIDVRLVTRIGAIMAVVLIVSLLAVGALFHLFGQVHAARGSEAAPRVTEAELPPQPRLQVHPGRDLQQVRALEDAHLNRYAWIDRSRGIAQVPIERAMVLWRQADFAASTNASSATTNLPASGETELQMRQQKAQENSHAP